MNALVIGVRRTGKSTLGYWLAQQSGARLIIIWDPNNNFRAFPGASTIDEFKSLLGNVGNQEYEAKTPFEYLYVSRHPEARKVYTIRYLPHPNQLEQEFEDFSDIVKSKVHGHYALLIDESDEAIQSRQQMCNALAWWMRRAPTDQDWPESVELVQMTHSPQDVYCRARNLITDVYVFKTNGELELKWIAEYAQNQEAAEIARTLSTPTKENPNAPRHVLHIYDGMGGEKEIEVLTDSSQWYIDIGSNRGKKQHG